jgi:xylulose-5-phosphate/fructose-6-phosphate phosphoketolase
VDVENTKGTTTTPWLMEHKAYIARHGDDMPEVTGWKWGQGAGAPAGGRSTESDNV